MEIDFSKAKRGGSPWKKLGKTWSVWRAELRERGKVKADPKMRFYQNVLFKKGVDACWLWTGFANESGYGRFRFRGRKTLAHRAAFEMFNGPIPDGMDVCHKCDTPPCCNPDHLFPGTQKDNTMDAVAKGRMAHKISPAQVLEIRAMRAAGAPIKEVAARFSITIGCVSQIANGKTRLYV